MKFLFIVQGEGRGHFTQAITLEDMLLRNGHQVVEVLVGKSSSRTLPGFFNRSIQAPVKRFTSPNFLPTAENKRAYLKKSFAYNLIHVPEYFRSMCYINQRIKETGAEVVINFYELLTGLTYALFRPSVPYVCIGHQYLFLHNHFEFPRKSVIQLSMLRFFTRMTSLRASRRLALSFRKMESDRTERISVVPPLLRMEATAMQPEQGNYIHGYMVNSGFADSVEAECSFGVQGSSPELVEKTLDELGLLTVRDRHPNTLSGGQKQRVAVAVSMICGKEVLVFDEPTSGLDYDSMEQVSGLIRELSKDKVIFVVTHDYEFVCQTCTRLIRFDHHTMTNDILLSQENEATILSLMGLGRDER